MTFPKRPFLTFSAAWVLLLICFSYLLTVFIAILCAALPFRLIRYAHQAMTAGLVLQAWILFFAGLFIASVILWALVPRRDQFKAPGTELKLSDHPFLQTLIKDVIACLGERMPDLVYLSTEANAWVAQRGGLLGFRSRRVMCLGLPLIATMTVDEFRALVAHECAHFYSGDTRLAPPCVRSHGSHVTRSNQFAI